MLGFLVFKYRLKIRIKYRYWILHVLATELFSIFLMPRVIGSRVDCHDVPLPLPCTLTKRTINSPWSTKNDTNLISIVLFCISRWLLGCVALLWGEEDKDVRERDRFSIELLPLSSTDCLDVLFFPRIISGERWHSSKHEDAVEVDYSHLTKVEK